MKNIIKSIVEFIVGIAMLPTAGAFVAYVNSDANLSGLLGFTLVMTLGLIIIAFGLIYNSAMGFFGKK